MACATTISIALCTYNGARFLKAQLDSISRQSRPPDELVVCDDGSTDDSVEMVRKFSTSSRFPVRLIQNSTKLGPTKNFEQAVRLCEGDIVALCDQDDVWHPHKLERLDEAFTVRHDAGLVFSDADVVDENLSPLGYTLWEVSGFTKSEQVMVAQGNASFLLLKRQVITGCTLAFRSSFTPIVTPIPETWVHDAWISFLIASVSPVTFLGNKLLQYRQHSSNQIGAVRKPFYQRLREASVRPRTKLGDELRRFIELHEKLQEMRKAKPEVLNAVEAKIGHLKTRSELPSLRSLRVCPVLIEASLFRYRKYSNGWKSVATDLFL